MFNILFYVVSHHGMDGVIEEARTEFGELHGRADQSGMVWLSYDETDPDRNLRMFFDFLEDKEKQQISSNGCWALLLMAAALLLLWVVQWGPLAGALVVAQPLLTFLYAESWGALFAALLAAALYFKTIRI
ncbi:hypothetical protein [Ferrimonas balearica]|uniref:hypothetical protein n=1 Tax=Ferrimonas balearica TaxID=44012 RepID=UPI001C99D7B9|nr:hypothetical protein [Ferrimonas balearica]MBY5991775.1 hypothetical protein [Ferrimonas balearica]